MSSRNVVRVQQLLDLLPAPVDREACVARVVENRPDRRRLPSIASSMTILTRHMRRRTRNPLEVQQMRNGLVSHPLEEQSKDPLNHGCRDFVDRQNPQAIPLLSLLRIRMRAGVHHPIAIRRASTLMLAINQHLSSHSGPHPALYMLTLTLRQTASDRHRHVMHGVLTIEPTTKTRNPQRRPVPIELRPRQAELNTEPAPSRLPHHQPIPAPVGILQRTQDQTLVVVHDLLAHCPPNGGRPVRKRRGSLPKTSRRHRSLAAVPHCDHHPVSDERADLSCFDRAGLVDVRKARIVAAADEA
jgi:hypothetical protein